MTDLLRKHYDKDLEFEIRAYDKVLIILGEF